MITILLVDDERPMLKIMGHMCEEMGYRVIPVTRHSDATTAIDDEKITFDIVITDLRLTPGSEVMAGLDVCTKTKQKDPATRVLCVTNKVTRELALIRSQKAGADAFIERAGDWENEFREVLRRFADERMAERNVDAMYTDSEINTNTLIEEELIRVAKSYKTVLFQGEVGTGKGHYVNRLAELSGKKVKHVNCAALAEGNALLVSLFGCIPNFYPGVPELPGLFELIDEEWIIFLDEIDQLSKTAQGALLTLLGERRFQRSPFIEVYGRHQAKTKTDPAFQLEIELLKQTYPTATPYHDGNYGFNHWHSFQGRIVCATNKDLITLVLEGKFLKDLLSRIMTFTITIPPLKDRMMEIPLLINQFIEGDPDAKDKGIVGVDAEAMTHLCEHKYRFGNVRELKHTLEGAILRARGPAIVPADIRFFHWPEDPDAGHDPGPRVNV